MSVRKARREFTEFVENLCPNCEVELTARGHIKVTFHGPHGSAIITQSGTPSDGRALNNAKAQAKRAAIKVGCLVSA